MTTVKVVILSPTQGEGASTPDTHRKSKISDCENVRKLVCRLISESGAMSILPKTLCVFMRACVCECECECVYSVTYVRLCVREYILFEKSNNFFDFFKYSWCIIEISVKLVKGERKREKEREGERER